MPFSGEASEGVVFLKVCVRFCLVLGCDYLTTGQRGCHTKTSFDSIKFLFVLPRCVWGSPCRPFSGLNRCSSLILTPTLQGGCLYGSHFANEIDVAWRGHSTGIKVSVSLVGVLIVPLCPAWPVPTLFDCCATEISDSTCFVEMLTFHTSH